MTITRAELAEAIEHELDSSWVGGRELAVNVWGLPVPPPQRGGRVKVRVITPDEMHERTRQFRASGLSRDDFERAELEHTGTALFVWWPEDDGHRSFSWLCPGCGRWHYGQIGDQPVGGWDAPRWVNSGMDDAPTLAPSLGCGGWKHGTCPEGHYWLRDGELVRA